MEEMNIVFKSEKLKTTEWRENKDIEKRKILMSVFKSPVHNRLL